MSDFVQSLVISGSIFAVMMATQLGRRDYTWHKVVMPILSVAAFAFAFAYLRHAPTSAVDIEVYGVGIAIGAVFAVLTTRVTAIERDSTTGKLMTRCGTAFLVTWLVSVAIRVGFVWSVTNVGSFREQVGEFMVSHQILETAIPPFFVLMALTTVVGRVAALGLRMSRVAPAASVAPVSRTALVTV